MDINKMRDLKALAETCLSHQSLRFMRSHGALYIRNDNGIVFDVHQNRSFPDLMAQNKDYADFALACTPATVLALLAELNRLATSRSKKERELEQELEVWHRGPFCWTCGDAGDVHDITGEWRGECDCLSAQLINANRERDQLKAENEALRKDAERYRFVRNPIGTSSPLAIWNEGKMPLFSSMADAVVDEFMAKEASHG
ncbi:MULTISPECIES: hypothetical protein [unclassified Pseudomonas]|uniref:hypothetical protein n=1 Tax=unclassified Pseudomonas TaxID=196821 RepID=UPI000485D3F0|nr:MULTISPECIES: hypothetical protein [unclassified Pseudomonas]RAS34037.1 hypothetical protein H040_00160 [Pseudomonas sp. URMO17WK12:I7]SME90654.1 hypothetical protein SAMN02745903_00160 [Pseudomonas sp. URMO17WK12:I5]